MTYGSLASDCNLGSCLHSPTIGLSGPWIEILSWRSSVNDTGHNNKSVFDMRNVYTFAPRPFWVSLSRLLVDGTRC